MTAGTLEALRGPLGRVQSPSASGSARGPRCLLAPPLCPVAHPVRSKTAAPIRPRRGRGLLTPLELRVLESASFGETSGQIAARLYVARNTVDSHLKHAFRKLGVHDRASAVAEGFRLGLLTPRPLRPGVVVPELPAHLAEVLPLLAEGCTKAQMAGRLGLKPGGVDHRLRRLYGFLGVRSRDHAVWIAIEVGYLALDAGAR